MDNRQQKLPMRLRMRVAAENGVESSGSSSGDSRRKLRRPECLNTVKKLHFREMGGFPRLARGTAVGTPERFRYFQLQEEFDTYDHSISWFFKLQFIKRRCRILEIVAANDVIFALSQSGLCAAFSRITNQRICFLNMSPDEVIRSIFYNRYQRAAITVSVYASDQFTSLKCRTTPMESIMRNQLNSGHPIFETESIKWPGFLEFDDVNGKVLTYAAEAGFYKVFDLKDYSLLYAIRDTNIDEIKISPGIMLLIYEKTRNCIPMCLRSIEDGRVLKSFNHLLHRNEKVDFIEQFNEKLLIKQENAHLQILDVRNTHVTEVNKHEFINPSSFIFLYENQLFLTFLDGKVTVWDFQGDIVTSFEDHLLWNTDGNTNNVYITSDQDLIVSYCKVEGGHEEEEEEEGEAPLGSINISDIHTGKCIAKMSPDDPSLQIAPRRLGDPNRSTIRSTISEALHDVTALYYSEENNEIYTGNKSGLLHIWSN